MTQMIKAVDQEFDGMKILDYLKKEFLLSVSLIKKVKFGGVFINGENVHMRAVVRSGDTVRVVLPDAECSDIKEIPMKLDVVYEDDAFIAINKPVGMPTHPSKGNSLPTLAEGVMAYYSGKNFVFRAINRLDRDTSGIVIVAKNAFSADKLSKVMKSGGFIKKYSAIVCGIPSSEHSIIDLPIERIDEGNIKRCVRPDGKPAITEYKVEQILNDGNSQLEITLHTGRTHQIRVHMAHIGHPLVGDFLYGERDGHKNYYLHAKSIEFIHPITGDTIKLYSKENFEYEKET